MKAIVYNKYGSLENLQLQEVDKPSPKGNEICIKIHAAAINSWDWDLIKGSLQGRIFGLFRPKWKIIGCDVAGIVEAIGNNVKNFKVGDEVFGDISGHTWGGFAEYVCTDEKFIAHKPISLSFAEAAAIPQAGVLALQGLTSIRPISSNQKILINGAGGGVGTFGIQIAKHHGAEVTVVDKAAKLERLSAIGADHLIDYLQTDYTQNGIQYDLIVDNVAQKNASAYSQVLTPNGIFKVIGGYSSSILSVLVRGSWISKRSNKHVGILAHEPNRADLIKLTKLIEQGHLKPIVDKIFPLEETKEAFRYYEKGNFVGKIVICM